MSGATRSATMAPGDDANGDTTTPISALKLATRNPESLEAPKKSASFYKDLEKVKRMEPDSPLGVRVNRLNKSKSLGTFKVAMDGHTELTRDSVAADEHGRIDRRAFGNGSVNSLDCPSYSAWPIRLVSPSYFSLFITLEVLPGYC